MPGGEAGVGAMNRPSTGTMPEIIDGLERPEEVRALLAEYTAGIVERSPGTADVLRAQGYSGELEDLAVKYGPPGGRLYLALLDGEPVGCAALRDAGDGGCELKRMYVRELHRGRGIASALLRRTVADARELGYSHVLLDTLPFMREAIAMYGRFGFRPTERYNDSPDPDTIYLRLDLGTALY